MKKLLRNILIFVFAFAPLTIANAASADVKTVDAYKSGTTVSFDGTTDEGVHAVTCILSENTAGEVDLVSVAVSSNAFTGSFNGIGDGEYTLSCANYDSGTPVIVPVDTNKTIKNVKITLTAPKPGDKVNIIDDGGFEEQDKLAEASTTDEGFAIEAAHYVKGTCLGGATDCDKYFEGTFEEGKDYYVMIYVYSKPGFKFTTASLDNVKINGQAPEEIFNVYPNGLDGTRTMFLAKIKSTNKTTETTGSTSNVKTGDNIYKYFALLLGATVSFTLYKIYSSKKQKNN